MHHGAAVPHLDSPVGAQVGAGGLDRLDSPSVLRSVVISQGSKSIHTPAVPVVPWVIDRLPVFQNFHRRLAPLDQIGGLLPIPQPNGSGGVVIQQGGVRVHQPKGLLEGRVPGGFSRMGRVLPQQPEEGAVRSVSL